MYGWVVRTMVRRAVGRLNAGDPGPLLASFADHATLVFPGRSSWSGEYRGKQEIERFLRRFIDAGLQLEPGAILVKGPPWSTTVCMPFTDHATDPDGTVVYTNRGVIMAKSAWGKIKLQEDYLDTQRVAALDERRAGHQPAVYRRG